MDRERGNKTRIIPSIQNDNPIDNLNDKEGDVTLTMNKLSAIANFYEFPVAVFFQTDEHWESMKDSTRLKELREDSEKLGRIREILGGDE